MLALATGTSRKDTAWQNTQLTWSKLVKKLSVTKHTKETVKQYHTFEDDRKAVIKDIGGFVGGMIAGGRRKRENIMSRSLITLDLDFVSCDIWALFELMYGCAGCIYSTHSHTPEKPRLRLIIPLNREVFVEEYGAIARRVAGNLDIEACDPSTYEENRLMYWPSTPSDGVYYFRQQEGPPLDADEVLASYADWRDITAWPTSSKDRKLQQHKASKVGSPIFKPGVIGAFCQEYSITDAIETFLPDIYTPTSDPNRYTYVKGSTFGGLAIYDENLFAFSHHSTDPTYYQNCNAFDLVRIHLYHQLDADKGEDVPINKLPSYLAMQDLATSDERVKVRLLAEKLIGREPNASEDEEEDLAWMGELKVDRKGNILATVDNLIIVLENDNKLKGKIAFDLFENREVWQGSVPWGARYAGQPFVDSDDANLWRYIELKYEISDTKRLHAAVQIVAKTHAYHPIREYIDAAKWDGIPRISKIFVDFLGVRDSLYVRTVSRKFFCAAVARIFEPGCKFDTMLVLVGSQGAFKSQILDRLGGRWFSDSLDDVTKGKESLEAIQGSWIIEWAELTGLRKAEVNKVKQFISKRRDRFRVAYGHRVEEFPRQCVFAGTSNTYRFLRDQSGNRRFWPLVVEPNRATQNVFTDLTPELVAQIWAEAKVVWGAGETLYLSREMEAEAMLVQSEHTEEDSRIGIIEQYINTPIPEHWAKMQIYERRQFLQSDAPVEDFDVLVMRDKVCANEIWAEALCTRVGEPMPTAIAADIHEIMSRMPGWQKGNRSRFGVYGSQITYVRINRAIQSILENQLAQEEAAFMQ